MALEAMGYGTMEEPRRPRRTQDPVLVAVRFALGAAFTITCVACLMIFSWSHVVHHAVELSSTEGLVTEIGKYDVAGKLLKERQDVASLSARYKQARMDLLRTQQLKKQNLMLQPVSGNVKELSGQLQKAESQLDKTTNAVVTSGENSAASSPKSSVGLKPSSDAAGPDAHPPKAGKLGFISGDRFGHDHVFRDGGYGPRDLVGDENAHYEESDWPYPPRPEWRHAYNNDDADESARHQHPYDMYLGFHPSVHYRDDRDVYSDGYGDHHGVHYDKQPEDYFGDFFHGRTDGYDWFHPEYAHADIGPGEYAWSMDHDPVIGDEGYSRYRPNFYMDWDGSGRNLDETKTMGEEGFLDDPRGAGFKEVQPQSLRLVAGATPRQRAEMAAMRRAVLQARARLGARRARQQQLTLRQEREGETAEPALGRWHGCSPKQIVGLPADDCDPLALKMAPALARHADQLAQRAEKTFAGVHWTSGDVDPKEDAFPLREAHGGYSGWADIEFPADKAEEYPTLYKPLVGRPKERAVGTKGTKAPTLKGERKQEAELAEGEEEMNKAAARLKVKAATARAQEAMAKEADKAAETRADLKVKVGDQVMRDALTKEAGEDRVRLLKAATKEYEEAAEEKREAREEVQEGSEESEQEPAAGEEAAAAGEEATSSAVQRAQDLVQQEKRIREEANALKEEEEVKVKAARDERDVVAATLAKLVAAKSA